MEIRTILIAIACAVVAFGAEAPVKKDVVRVGVILPLSGNNDNLGKPQLLALKLFKEELSKKQTRHNYEFIVEDDQCLAREAVMAAQKMIHVDKVAAIVSMTSGSGNALSPISQEYKVLHFGMASDDKVAKGEYNFTHWLRPQPEAPLLGQYLKAAGVKTVGILIMRQQQAYVTAEEFKKVFPQYGLEIEFVESFVPGERDFRTFLLKLPRPLPDATIVMALSPEMDILLKNMQVWGSSKVVTSVHNFDLVQDKRLIEGRVYVSAAAPVDDYTEKFMALNKEEPEWVTPYFYDILTLIVEGLEQCPNPDQDRTPALAYLTKVKEHPSAVGSISAGGPGGRIFDVPICLYKTVNGKKIRVGLEEAIKSEKE